jgi:hypothetical protein
MYPAVPLFQITWGNAARLLLLADKYDMPAVTEHVRLFLDPDAFCRILLLS